MCFAPHASVGARQALSVVNNQRGAEMGIFASSSLSAHFFSFPPGDYVLCNRLTHCLGRLSRNTRCYGHPGKKSSLSMRGDSDKIIKSANFIDSEHRSRGELWRRGSFPLF